MRLDHNGVPYAAGYPFSGWDTAVNTVTGATTSVRAAPFGAHIAVDAFEVVR